MKNTFEQQMEESYKKLENHMSIIAAYFPHYRSKGFLAENIMLLDFLSRDFNDALSITKTFGAQNENGWITYKGIEFRMVTYPKTNRIAFTF
jgi:hypothetical protein